MEVGLHNVLTTVLYAVNAQAVQHIRTRFVAANGGDCLDGISHIERPTALEVNDRSVLHNDKAERRVLGGETVNVPIAPGITRLRVLVEFVERLAHAVRRLVVVHHMESKVKRVRSDIDKRTAALLFLVDEHAPGGNGSSADCDCLCVINLAEFAVLRHLLHIHTVRTPSALIADSKHFVVLLCGFDHLLRFFVRSSHRLFAQNVLARVERVHGDVAMLGVVSKHEYCVDGRVFEQFFIVGVYGTVFVAEIFLCFFGTFGNDVAERYHFSARISLFCRHMLSVCDSAATDYAQTQYFFGHFFHIFVTPLKIFGRIAGEAFHFENGEFDSHFVAEFKYFFESDVAFADNGIDRFVVLVVLFDVQAVELLAVLLHLIGGQKSCALYPIGIDFAVETGDSVKKFLHSVGAVGIFLIVVVIAEYHAAFVKFGLDFLDFFDDFGQFVRKIFLADPRNEHGLNADGVDVVELIFDIVKSYVCRNAFEIVFIQKIFHLDRRHAVKAGKFHAGIACFGYHFQYFFHAQFLNLVAKRIHLYS